MTDKTKIPTREELLKRLETLPELMWNAESEMLEFRDKLDNHKTKLKDIERNIRSNVVSDIEDGKPKFRNEIARTTEIERRITVHKEHQDIRNEMSKTAKKLKEQEIGFNFLDRKFKAARIMAQLIGGNQSG